MLNENIIFGHNEPVILKHENPTTQSPRICILFKVCDENNSEGWSDDETCFVLCGFVTKVMADLSDRRGEGCTMGQHAGGAQEALCPSSRTPLAGLLPGTWRRVLLGFKDLSSLGHPSNVTRIAFYPGIQRTQKDGQERRR